MNIPGFTDNALQKVQELLYAEGECKKKKTPAEKKPPTPAQEKAAEARRGAPSNVDPSVRQERARKGAATRKKCQAQQGPPAPTTPTTNNAPKPPASPQQA